MTAKGTLIKKALGADDITINVAGDTISFPWFREIPEPDKVKAYTELISALCKMSKELKRVSAIERPVENEKYAFRCFLLRLGFIGDEYKTTRRILLRNLSGNSAWRNGAPEKEAAADFADGIIHEGQRNSTMSHIAGRLIKRYGNTEEAHTKFLEQAAACDPPLDESELQTIWNSAVGFGKRVSAQEGYIPPEEYNNPTPRKPGDYSDLGQAYVFAKFCRDYVRKSRPRRKEFPACRFN